MKVEDKISRMKLLILIDLTGRKECLQRGDGFEGVI
jgi:hypothetical protein